MAKLFNRVKVNTATTGTGTMTLGAAAASNFFTAAEAGVANNDVVAYVIEDGTDVEVGIGTYTSAGTTLSRTTVRLSKIAGVSGTTKLSLSGAAIVFLSPHKEDLGPLSEANSWAAAQTHINASGVKILDTDASNTTGIVGGSNLTADRTLTITTGDANRTITLNGDTTLSGTNTGDGAASTEAYVTIGNTAGLSAERALTAGQGITITDAGANNTVTVETVNGSVLQTLQATYTTNAALATTIPFDDTTPQSTEGVQILSQAITPADNTNKVLCRVSVWGCTDFSTSFSIIAALFRGTTCINVAAQTNPNADSPACVQFEFLDSPASASAQTYTVRVGAETGSAIRLNGTTGARRFGGTSACTLTVEEIKA